MTSDDPVDQAAEEARQKMAQTAADFDERLAALEEKARRARTRMENERAREQERRRSDGEASRGLGFGLTIAYTILGVPVMGYAIGWLIDRSAGGPPHWQNLLAAGGCIVGLAYAIWLLQRANAR